jgi:geranylgeranyl transferase type-2 subunit alpha
MYTDPNDQSVWMYHRWLVDTGKDIPTLKLMTVLS